MKINKLTSADIKYYFKKHSSKYISFIAVVLVGVVFGIVIAMSNDGYLKLLTKENKILYSVINGSAKTGSLFWKKLIQLLSPVLLIFLVNLNYYLSFLSYVIIAYQTSLLTMSIFAVVASYGVSGVLNVIFIMIPINALYIFVLIYFSVVNLERIKVASRNKNFLFGIKDSCYLSQVICSIIGVVVIVFIGVMILPMFLKNAIFIIFWQNITYFLHKFAKFDK